MKKILILAALLISSAASVFAQTNATAVKNDTVSYLIGVNFDRVWEGTMSDVVFDPEVCRNISLDIRFALFVIDRLAGANHLIEEMEIVK